MCVGSFEISWTSIRVKEYNRGIPGFDGVLWKKANRVESTSANPLILYKTPEGSSINGLISVV